jgi:sulfate adenylyltransferase
VTDRDPATVPVPRSGDLLATTARAAELRAEAAGLPEHACSPAQLRDLEALLAGWYAPLDGYPGPDDLVAVAARRELHDSTPWPEPVRLVVPEALGAAATAAGRLALRDPEGVLLAVVTVRTALPTEGGTALTGTVEGVALPVHHDHVPLRRSPDDVRIAGGPATVVVRRPLLAPDVAALAEATSPTGAGLVVLVVDGGSPADDVAHHARLRAVLAALAALPDAVVSLAPLPSALGGADPVALDAAVAARVSAARLLVLGEPDNGRDDLQPADVEFAVRVGVAVEVLDRSGAPTADQLAAWLDAGDPLPDGLAPPGVEAELRRAHPSRAERGVVVLLSGLSGSGKSTIAGALVARMAARGGRSITLLDGDLVRRHLSSELGFSRAHRDINVRRIGWVAAEIAKHGGLAVCCPIAPYDETRRAVRAMVDDVGACFVLVHVATTLEECEARDRKGLYAKARAGEIPEFTGISDPYDVPTDAEIVIHTSATTADDAAAEIETWLATRGWLG